MELWGYLEHQVRRDLLAVQVLLVVQALRVQRELQVQPEHQEAQEVLVQLVPLEVLAAPARQALLEAQEVLDLRAVLVPQVVVVLLEEMEQWDYQVFLALPAQAAPQVQAAVRAALVHLAQRGRRVVQEHLEVLAHQE